MGCGPAAGRTFFIGEGLGKDWGRIGEGLENDRRRIGEGSEKDWVDHGGDWRRTGRGEDGGPGRGVGEHLSLSSLIHGEWACAVSG